MTRPFTFRISPILSGLASFGFVEVVSAPVAFVTWPHLAAPGIAVILGVIPATAGLAMAAASALFGRVLIEPDGLVLFRVRRIRWNDIEAVEVPRAIVLPELRLRLRHRQVRVTVPLYLRGDIPIRTALCSAAPPGHPIVVALKE